MMENTQPVQLSTRRGGTSSPSQTQSLYDNMTLPVMNNTNNRRDRNTRNQDKTKESNMLTSFLSSQINENTTTLSSNTRGTNNKRTNKRTSGGKQSQVSTSDDELTVTEEEGSDGDYEDPKSKRSRRTTTANSVPASVTSSTRGGRTNNSVVSPKSSASVSSKPILDKLGEQVRNLEVMEEFLVETKPLGSSAIIQQAVAMANLPKTRNTKQSSSSSSTTITNNRPTTTTTRALVVLPPSGKSRNNTTTTTTTSRSNPMNQIPEESDYSDTEDEAPQDDETENEEEEDDDNGFVRRRTRRLGAHNVRIPKRAKKAKQKATTKGTPTKATTTTTKSTPPAAKPTEPSDSDDSGSDSEIADDNISMDSSAKVSSQVRLEIRLVAQYRNLLRKCRKLPLPEVRKVREDFEAIEDQALIYALNGFQAFENTLEVDRRERQYSNIEHRNVAINASGDTVLQPFVYISWKRILRENWVVFGPKYRIAMDLKDRWRNLCKQKNTYNAAKIAFGAGYNDTYASVAAPSIRNVNEAATTYLQARSLGMARNVPDHVLPRSVLQLSDTQQTPLDYRPIPLENGVGLDLEELQQKIDTLRQLHAEYLRTQPLLGSPNSTVNTSPSGKGPGLLSYERFAGNIQRSIIPVTLTQPFNSAFKKGSATLGSQTSRPITYIGNKASQGSSSSSSSSMLSPVISQGNINHLATTSLLTIILTSTRDDSRTRPITVMSSDLARKFFKQHVPTLYKQIIDNKGNVQDIDELIIRYDTEAQNERYFPPGARLVRQWLLLRGIDKVTTLYDLFHNFWKPHMSPIILQLDAVYKHEDRATNEYYTRMMDDANRYAQAGLYDFK